MKKVYTLATIVFSLLLLQTNAQVAINNTSTAADASAMLDVNSSSKGMLMPRIALTSANSAAPISSPQASLLVYNTATAGSGGNAVTPGFYYWNGTAWVRLTTGSSSSSGWFLQGNAGTDTTVNFIGTTDNEPLVFKVNGKRAGMLQDSASIQSGNIAWGVGSLATSTGGNNIAMGTAALNKNTTGIRNIAIGPFALQNNVGSLNVALGYQASNSTTTGSRNIVIGNNALFSNQSSSGIIAIGDSAGYATTSGIGNMFVGYRSGRYTVDGYRNTYIGYQAGLQSITGHDNVAIGTSAGNSNLSHQNVFIGSGAGFSNELGNNNVFIGNSTGSAKESGFNNTFIGSSAGRNTVAGSDNIFIGLSTAKTNTGGLYNTIIGDNADVGGVALSNATAIGYSAYVTQSNCLVLGSISGINGATADTKVGIGTTDPTAMLQVNSNANTGLYGLYVTGTTNLAAVAPNVIGSTMYFHPGRGIFRAGYADGTQWNGINAGAYSIGLGYDAIARGERSFAGNEYTEANGIASVAFGSNTKANGAATFVANSGTRAEADASSVFGYATVAKGFASTVVGINNDSLLTIKDNSFNSNTPLFVVGNGTSSSIRSNAMVVRGSGTVQVENLQVGGGTIISRQQVGTYVAGTSDTQLKQFTFNFPVAFATAPKIIVTPRAQAGTNNNDTYVVTVRSISTTSVTVNVLRVDVAAGWGQSLQLDWFAWE